MYSAATVVNILLLLFHTGHLIVYSKPTSGSTSSHQSSSIHSSAATTSYELTANSAPSQLQNDPTRAIHYHFDQEMDPYMQLHKFDAPTTDGNNATCNDGSPAGYYKRLNNHSKTWIIYLQGGGYCGSEEACQLRWRRSAHLMTSNFWPKSLSVEGILSSEPRDNPYLWNANHIYVPYCSSDSWTGSQEARPEPASSFAFMGSRIIEKVLASLFDDLPRDSSLFEARFVLFAGDSAGATGVILNLDKVNRLIHERFNPPAATTSPLGCSGQQDNLSQPCEARQVAPIIRGLADSGWFLDNEPYDIYQQMQRSSGSSLDAATATATTTTTTTTGGFAPAPTVGEQFADCDKQRCSPLQTIRQAMLHWNGQVPAACASRQMNEPWRCYFAYRAYPTLRTPLFVVQWLYDEAQLMVDNIVRPGTISQWNYVNSLIIKQSWNQININGFKLPHILNSWEEETLANQPSYNTLLRDYHQEQQYLLNSDQVSSNNQREQVYDKLSAQQQQHHQIDAINQQTRHQLETRSAISRPISLSSASSGSVVGTNTQFRVRSRKKKRNNNNNNNNNNSQSLNRPSSNTNRLSRSTSVVDEATAIVLNNNVPDLFLAAAGSRQQVESVTEKFRLIDTCGWPQCNRDCPNLDLDFGLRSILSK